MSAKNVDEGKKGANSIKKILGSLNQIAVGIAELRNEYGSGHGKDKNFRGLTPRHARLAVGSAANFVNFLWETHTEKTMKREDIEI
ncbi:MAG: abortive infection family protein [Treponema sp.]|nr:abortive infection family protein [Treponema sp.]